MYSIWYAPIISIINKIEIKSNVNLERLKSLLNNKMNINPKNNIKWISKIGVAVIINRNSIKIDLKILILKILYVMIKNLLIVSLFLLLPLFLFSELGWLGISPTMLLIGFACLIGIYLLSKFRR